MEDYIIKIRVSIVLIKVLTIPTRLKIIMRIRSGICYKNSSTPRQTYNSSILIYRGKKIIGNNPTM